MAETLKPGDRVKTINPEDYSGRNIPVGSEGIVRDIGVPDWEPGNAVPVDFDHGMQNAIVWFKNIRKVKPAPDQLVWNVGDTAILPAGTLSLTGSTVAEDTTVTITKDHVDGYPGKVRVSGARVRSFYGIVFTAHVFSVSDLRKPEPPPTITGDLSPASFGIKVPASVVDEDTLRYNGHDYVKSVPEVPTITGSIVAVEGYSDHLLTDRGWVNIGTGYMPRRAPDHYGKMTVKRVGRERTHSSTRATT